MPLRVAGACLVTDASGQPIKLAKPAMRMMVLAPDLVENVFAVGAGDRIVGVVQGSDYPAAARHITQVGSYAGIDLERIVAAHPDLIVAWKYAFPRQLAALKRLGIPVYVAAPKTLDDIPRLMRHLGCLVGKQKTAALAAQHFEMDIEKLKASKPLTPSPTVFFQIDRQALMTVNRDSWINQVIELCGGKNIFASAATIAPLVSREAIVVANPDVVFNNAKDNGWQQSWQRWPEITAVGRHRLYSIHPDVIARAGPRLIQGARQICRQLRA